MIIWWVRKLHFQKTEIDSRFRTICPTHHSLLPYITLLWIKYTSAVLSCAVWVPYVFCLRSERAGKRPVKTSWIAVFDCVVECHWNKPQYYFQPPPNEGTFNIDINTEPPKRRGKPFRWHGFARPFGEVSFSTRANERWNSFQRDGESPKTCRGKHIILSRFLRLLCREDPSIWDQRGSEFVYECIQYCTIVTPIVQNSREQYKTATELTIRWGWGSKIVLGQTGMKCGWNPQLGLRLLGEGGVSIASLQSKYIQAFEWKNFSPTHLQNQPRPSIKLRYCLFGMPKRQILARRPEISYSPATSDSFAAS